MNRYLNVLKNKFLKNPDSVMNKNASGFLFDQETGIPTLGFLFFIACVFLFC